MKPIGSSERSTRKNTASVALAPGSVACVTFTDLLPNGQAVGRIDGLVIFVSGPLPGERVTVRVTAVKAKYAVGDAVSYETTSELRAAPFCDVFGVCGGCQVQHLSYPGQLAWKERIVRNALRRIGGFAAIVVEHPVGMTRPAPYRNKMSLVVQAQAGRTRLGFYQARSHELVPIDACPVVVPQLNAAIAGLQRAADDPATQAAFDGVKHAIVRVGTASGQAVLSLTTERHSPAIGAAAPALATQLRGIVGISNSFEPRNANAVMGRKMAYVWGAREMEEAIENVRFRVSPASFFQVNSEMVGKIFAFMEPALRSAPRTIVDLYCGAGTFAIFFACRGARVVGVRPRRAASRRHRLPRSAAQGLRRGDARCDRRGGRRQRLVSVVQSGDVGARFALSQRPGLHARHRATVRYVSADGTRRDLRRAAPSWWNSDRASAGRYVGLGRADPPLAR
jgi:23S rRNA (uracil1939-C5)-methyltransferase